VPQVEAWVSRRLRNSTPLAVEEVRQELALPLLSQIQTDAGRTVARLARERIGLDGDTVSVRVQARAMGVTRTRIYQLLDECAKVMEVRWQDGGCRLQALAERYGLLATLDQEPVIRLFHRVRSLFFPPRFVSNE
jgi:hypothetical protein